MSSRVTKMMLARTVGNGRREEHRREPEGREDMPAQNRKQYWYGEIENRDRDRHGRFARMESGYREPRTDYRMEDSGREQGERELRGGYEPSGHYGGGKGQGKIRKIGFAQQKPSGKITEHEARDIAKRFACANGEKGPHWGYEQIKALVENNRMECEPAEMFLVVNALYCDYCWVMQKYGMDSLDVYVDLAIAWIKDEDAVEDKVAVYFREIAK